MILCFKIIKKGGIYICKFFDLFNDITIKLLYILKEHFEELYIHKPKTSRPANSERYIICKGFKNINKSTLNCLEKILIDITDDEYTLDGLSIPKKFMQYVIEHNKQFVQNQIYYVESTLGYINNKPTRLKYNQIIATQIKNAIDWCKKYNFELNQNSKYLKKNKNISN